jgi:predicted amidohydrolase YtcJ
MVQKADIVIYGNHIFNGTQANTFAGAIGIADKQIIFVGDEEGVTPFLSQNTKIIHYENQFIMPGMIDAHTHVQTTMMHKEGVDVSRCSSAKECAQKIRLFHETHPEKEWILAYGWLMSDWQTTEFPTKDILDQVVSSKPVIATQGEEHGMWLNTKAMEWLGIDRNFPGIKEGYVKVDDQGNPSGCLFEGSMKTIIQKCYNFSTKQAKEILHKFSDYASANGVTAVTDMRPLFGVNLGKDEAYEAYAKEGKGIRYFTTLQLDTKNCDKVLELQERWIELDMLYCVGFKEFMDGVASAYTAYLSKPYSDNPTTCGQPFMTKEVLEEKVMAAHAKGISIHIHCIGDAAIRMTLDAYEKANKVYGRQKQRHTIEHVEVLDDTDVNRFAQYDITASVQPEHLVLMSQTDEGETYRNFFGEERESMLFRYKDILDTGANVAFGTDVPIVDINPFIGIYRAMTRVHNDGLPLGGWNSSQKFTIYDALKAYTYGAAYSVGLEESFGQIKVGHYADLIVVDRNLTAVTPDEIRNASIVMTMVNGQEIYKNQEKIV